MKTSYCVTAPSNIALIKYWGKKDKETNWPANDSISMTLRNSRTKVIAKVDSLDQLFFEGEFQQPDSSFALKTFHLLNKLREVTGFSEKLCISTENSFPAACGIASSASSMAAITVAALAAWTQSQNLQDLEDQGYGVDKISMLAKLGSGSACRSFWKGFVHWQSGRDKKQEKVSPLPFKGMALADIILLVDHKSKKVSSSEAHEWAWSSPLFLPRLYQVPRRIQLIENHLINDQFDALGEILEQEALDMHGVMMSSEPPARYLSKQTTELLAWIRMKRMNHIFSAYFTLDAGPNIHLLCRDNQVALVLKELEKDFPDLKYIHDEICDKDPITLKPVSMSDDEDNVVLLS